MGNNPPGVQESRTTQREQARRQVARLVLLIASPLVAAWAFKVDALLGIAAGQATGEARLSYMRPHPRPTGYGAQNWYLTVAGQPPGAPTQFTSFAPGVFDQVVTFFGAAGETVPPPRRATIHYAGLGRHVVTAIQ